MEVLKVSKNLFSPVSLPGMGRSIEVNDISREEILRIQSLVAQENLAVEFVEEPGTQYPVLRLWINPHEAQVTLFV
jgi:hypothetical protein